MGFVSKALDPLPGLLPPPPLPSLNPLQSVKSTESWLKGAAGDAAGASFAQNRQTQEAAFSQPIKQLLGS